MEQSRLQKRNKPQLARTEDATSRTKPVSEHAYYPSFLCKLARSRLIKQVFLGIALGWVITFCYYGSLTSQSASTQHLASTTVSHLAAPQTEFLSSPTETTLEEPPSEPPSETTLESPSEPPSETTLESTSEPPSEPTLAKPPSEPPLEPPSEPIQTEHALLGKNLSKDARPTRLAVVMPIRLDGGLEVRNQLLVHLLNWEKYRPCSVSLRNRVDFVFMYGEVASSDPAVKATTEFNKALLRNYWQELNAATTCFGVEPQIIPVRLEQTHNQVSLVKPCLQS
eukprot:188427-Pyramimonas_sp.AAC.1